MHHDKLYVYRHQKFITSRLFLSVHRATMRLRMVKNLNSTKKFPSAVIFMLPEPILEYAFEMIAS